MRKGWHLDLNWLVCVKLGLWSFQLFDTNVLHGCWLFWQNEILFLAFPSFIYIFVSFYVTSPPALNWDCGNVSCCTNVLHECWLFDKMRTWISFISTSITYLQIWSIWSEWMIKDFGRVDCATNILCGCQLYWQEFHLPRLSFSLSMLYSALPPYSFIDLLSLTYI